MPVVRNWKNCKTKFLLFFYVVTIPLTKIGLAIGLENYGWNCEGLYSCSSMKPNVKYYTYVIYFISGVSFLSIMHLKIFGRDPTRPIQLYLAYRRNIAASIFAIIILLGLLIAFTIDLQNYKTCQFGPLYYIIIGVVIGDSAGIVCAIYSIYPVHLYCKKQGYEYNFCTLFTPDFIISSNQKPPTRPKICVVVFVYSVFFGLPMAGDIAVIFFSIQEFNACPCNQWIPIFSFTVSIITLISWLQFLIWLRIRKKHFNETEPIYEWKNLQLGKMIWFGYFNVALFIASFLLSLGGIVLGAMLLSNDHFYCQACEFSMTFQVILFLVSIFQVSFLLGLLLRIFLTIKMLKKVLCLWKCISCLLSTGNFAAHHHPNEINNDVIIREPTHRGI